MDVALSLTQRLRRRRELGRASLAAAGAGILCLTAAAAALGASAPVAHPGAEALLRGAMVAAPLGVALLAVHVPPYARFGRLLATAGAVSFVTTFAESQDATLYGVGRAAGWLLEGLLVVVLLAYPSGRLEAAIDRRLAGAIGAVLITCYLPTLLVAHQLKVPSPYTSCTHACPPNVFLVFDAGNPGAGSALFAIGSVLAFAVLVGVLVRLRGRIARATPLERQMLVPVLTVGMGRVAVVGGAIVARDVLGAEDVARVSASLVAWGIPAIAVAFLAGMARSRLHAEQTLRRLAACVRCGPSVPALERAFAAALDDPSVEILFPRGGGEAEWIDHRGHAAGLAAGDERRCLHVIHGQDGAVTAGIACDRALAERPELLHAAAGLAAVALDNLRLAAEAHAAARDAHASRARIAVAADQERRRIERDLHDGAQQRLVALRIELSLVEDLALRDPPRCAVRIRELEDEVEAALDELRALAHGLCPPLLADRGLVESLQAAAGRSSVPASLEVDRIGRYAPEIESAVYFCVLEALQNVAKHAAGARRAVVRLTGGGVLRLSVRDDGAGAPAAALHGGAGLTNMRDRIAAVGGNLHVRSRPGAGTEVSARIPLPAGAACSGATPGGAHPEAARPWTRQSSRSASGERSCLRTCAAAPADAAAAGRSDAPSSEIRTTIARG